MKKLLVFLLLGLFFLDVDAQALFATTGSQVPAYLPGLSAGDEFSDMLKKRRKKRRGKSKRRGKGSSGLLAGPGLTLAVPTGDLSLGAKTGFGVTADAEYFLMPQLTAGLSTGFYSFGYDEGKSHVTGKFSMVPVLGKVNYFWIDDPVKFYTGVGLGATISRNKYEYGFLTYYDNLVTGEVDSLMITKKITKVTTDFTLASQAGVMFNVTDNLLLNANVRFLMCFTKNAGPALEDILNVLEIEEKTTANGFFGLNAGLIYLLDF